MRYKADHVTGKIEQTQIPTGFRCSDYSVHESWGEAHRYLRDIANQEIINADKQSKSAQLFADLVAQNSPPNAK